jgi:hypothetical protein
VEECNAVTLITDWNESRACKKAISVEEDVKGPLRKLPGGNDVTGLGGSAREREGCTDTVTLLATLSTPSLLAPSTASTPRLTTAMPL